MATLGNAPEKAPSPPAPAETKAPEPLPSWDTIKEKIWRRYRWRGFIPLALLAGFLYIWTHSKEISEWPGVHTVVERVTQDSIPHATRGTFSVAVAHLDNDRDQEHERLIFAALGQFPGIEVLRFDRVITARGDKLKQGSQAGHEQARELIKQAGADAMLWGEVLRKGNTSLALLHWTTAQESAGIKAAERYKPKEDNLDLPDLFWDHLIQVLGLVVASGSSEYEAQRGHYVVDKLKPFVEQVGTLLSESDSRWSQSARADVVFLYANALTTLGEQSGSNSALTQAVTAYQEAIKERTRDKIPLDWAATQNNLGNALQRLGERESDTQHLTQAVTAYQEALKERTRDKVPLDWAMTQNNLGTALTSLGERESDTQRLRQAVTAYQPLKGAPLRNAPGFFSNAAT
jgi:tetratricopeptide (TPR) repeat protein